MGRRSYGISMSQISRMVSASNAREKYEERVNLINSQAGIKTEKEPVYIISDFDFNEMNRIAHIEFTESKEYRRIEKYVTQDGVKYPIYSDWLTKTKKIKRIIKLTNENLENMKNNEDFLISKYSYEIVKRICNDNFYPSWFFIDTFLNEKSQKIKEITAEYNEKIKLKKYKINNAKDQIEKNQFELTNHKKKLDKFEHKKLKKERKLLLARKKDHILILSIISFGIFYLFHSNCRISKIENKINLICDNLKKEKANIRSIEKNNNELNLVILNSKIEIDDLNKNEKINIQSCEDIYEEKNFKSGMFTNKY